MNKINPSKETDVDAIIIGGGIAGLFTLAKLINRGYRAVLLEKSALGAGQTLKSQGIIHGGTKYSLLGKTTPAQQKIAGLPDYWRGCLSGRGDVDLSECELLAEHQCMWALPNLSSTVTGFFASRLMKSHVAALPSNKRAKCLNHIDCKGSFYQLNEPVIDSQSLVAALANKYSRYILTDCIATVNARGVLAHTKERDYSFITQQIIMTAGQGNGDFSNQQQLRPLRMLFATVPPSFGKVYIHILEASDKPRVTITSHMSDKGWVWYLGGNLAEKCTELSHHDSIDVAKKELEIIFPWLDFSEVSFDSFLVNRAEGKTQESKSTNKRPDMPVVTVKKSNDSGQQIITAWPTKLVMAPLLADHIIDLLEKPHKPLHFSRLPDFPPFRLADFPWGE